VRRLARLADVEAAVPEALSHGMLFFADITHNQVDASGLALLRFVAAQGEGAVRESGNAGASVSYGPRGDSSLAYTTRTDRSGRWRLSFAGGVDPALVCPRRYSRFTDPLDHTVIKLL
jgi:hypothetical protein